MLLIPTLLLPPSSGCAAKNKSAPKHTPIMRSYLYDNIDTAELACPEAAREAQVDGRPTTYAHWRINAWYERRLG